MSLWETEAAEKYREVFLPDEARPKAPHQKMIMTTCLKKGQLNVRGTTAAPLWHCVLTDNTSTK